MRGTIGMGRVIGLGFCLAALAGLVPARTAASGALKIGGAIQFEANRGQADSRVKFLARGSGANLFVTQHGAEMALRHASAREPGAVVSMELVGAAVPRIAGEGGTGTLSHYYYGGPSQRSVTGVPHYERVRFREAYRGIDLVFYGGGEGLEYDFVLRPGARPGAIRLRYRGMRSHRLEADGDLVLETSAGPVRHRKPVAYQIDGGARTTVPCAFRTRSSGEAGAVEVEFALGRYDTTRPLTIDPILDFATYLGGSGAGDEYARGVATSASGSRVYLTGDTSSLDYPGRSGIGSGQDVFVTCLDSRGRPRWNVFLVGSGDELGFDIALGPLERVCVTGSTTSPDFPLFRPFKNQNSGGTRDGFLTVLSPFGGQPLLSTYIGGPEEDGGYAVAFNTRGELWGLFGCGPGLATTRQAAQRFYGGGSGDAYLMKVQMPGLQRPRVAYATYIGGSDYDSPAGLALDRFGNVYAAGNTLSPDFPTTPGVVQPAHAGLEDQWVTKIADRGGHVVYSTYLGGFAVDYLFDLDVVNGEAFLGGANVGGNFPTTPGAFQPTPPGGVHDGTVARLNASGTQLIYSTYLGTPGFDAVRGIAVDPNGSAYLGIETDSASFPTVRPTQGTYGGGPSDCAVVGLNPVGSGLTFSTFVGGSGLDRCFYECIARSRKGAVYFVGQTDSADFPTLRALQPDYGGGPFDAFVVRLRP